MKKVLSLFTLCAIFAFAGCCKNKEEKHKSTKKEHTKKEKCSKCSKDKKNCLCKKADKKMKHHVDHAHKSHAVKETK